MSLLYFLGYRSFKSELEIKQIVADFIADSTLPLPNASGLDESMKKTLDPTRVKISPMDIHALKILETSKQQTWIVLAQGFLYCLLDDISKDIQKNSELIKWRSKTKDIKNHINVKASSKNSEKYGLVDFGPKHLNWYFSKSLLNDEEMAKTHIKNLVSAH